MTATTFSDLNVAVVDNNRTAKYVLAQYLENWGISVTQFDDLNALETTIGEDVNTFDVIFSVTVTHHRYDLI